MQIVSKDLFQDFCYFIIDTPDIVSYYYQRGIGKYDEESSLCIEMYDWNE